jgi:mono/diheme cytochrome c family protein
VLGTVGIDQNLVSKLSSIEWHSLPGGYRDGTYPPVLASPMHRERVRRSIAMARLKPWLVGGLIVVAVVFIGIQFVPYGRAHDNPAVVAEPAWDSPETRALAVRACFSCHSNETEWPWYSNIAPMSWMVQRDVDEGRASLNFSEWHLPQEEADESAETVRDGEMPPRIYQLTRARLSDEELDRLATGLAATLGDDD